MNNKTFQKLYNPYSTECNPIEKSRIMPGFLLGQQGSLAGIDAAFRAGVSDIEIVLPHHDQKMDGSIIKSASKRIFEESSSFKPSEMIRDLGEYLKIYRFSTNRNHEISYLHVMSYFQGIFQGRHKPQKIQNFVSACYKSRISNLIIPDIPDDPDGDLLQNLASESRISITKMITPKNNKIMIPTVKYSDVAYIIPKRGQKTGKKVYLDNSTYTVLEQVSNRLPGRIKLIGFGITPESVNRLQSLGYTPVFCSPMVAELSRVRESLATDDPQEIYNQYYKASRNLINQYSNI